MIFIIQWVSISLTERNNCSFPAGLNEFFLNSGSKGLKKKHHTIIVLANPSYPSSDIASHGIQADSTPTHTHLHTHTLTPCKTQYEVLVCRVWRREVWVCGRQVNNQLVNYGEGIWLTKKGTPGICYWPPPLILEVEGGGGGGERVGRNSRNCDVVCGNDEQIELVDCKLIGLNKRNLLEYWFV